MPLRIHAKFLTYYPECECIYQESDCIINGKIGFDRIAGKGSEKSCLYYYSHRWYISFDFDIHEIFRRLPNYSYYFCQDEDNENTDLPPVIWFDHRKQPIITFEISDTGDNIKG